MPLRNREELTPEQQTARHIEAMGHSENLIRELVAAGNYDDNIEATIQRNVDHLALMLSKENITNSGSDRLVGFQEAVTLGTDFLAQA